MNGPSEEGANGYLVTPSRHLFDSTSSLTHPETVVISICHQISRLQSSLIDSLNPRTEFTLVSEYSSERPWRGRCKTGIY